MENTLNLINMAKMDSSKFGNSLDQFNRAIGELKDIFILSTEDWRTFSSLFDSTIQIRF